jgi:hypothetical protein
MLFVIYATDTLEVQPQKAGSMIAEGDAVGVEN